MKRLREPQDDLDSPSPGAHGSSLQHALAIWPPSKIPELSPASVDADQDKPVAMRCSLPPHKTPVEFGSYGDFEVHYVAFHTHRCLECHKNFPSDHLLGVHIEECHDPLVGVRRERGEHTFSCLVDGCDRKCLTQQKRRMHMIDKHMYPKNFFFDVTREGIDGRRSLLNETGHRRRRSSAVTLLSNSQSSAHVPNARRPEQSDSAVPDDDVRADQSEEKAAGAEMKELSEALSALNFVPASIRFGRGRAGFARR